MLLLFVYHFWVCATEFWETKSLARLSDYDTTRGNVNGNIFHWEITIGSQLATFLIYTIVRNASFLLSHVTWLPHSLLLLHLSMHMNILLTSSDGSSE